MTVSIQYINKVGVVYLTELYILFLNSTSICDVFFEISVQRN